MSLLRKIAELGDYLDSRGHSEESRQVDQVLKSLAEDQPLLYQMVGVNNKDKPGFGRDNMPNLDEDQPAQQAKQPQQPTVPQQPIGLTYIMRAQQGGTDQKALAHMIYNRVYPNKPDIAKTLSETKTLEDAIKLGLAQNVIYDDRSKWYKPSTWKTI